MRIHLDNVAPEGTGPGTFAHRLARALFEAGHEVTFDSASAHVSLVFIEPSGAPLAPAVVQRLDGIWFKPEEYESRNRGIKSLYGKARGVVFQSEFDKTMIERRWGSNHDRQRPCVIIGNGVQLAPVKELTIPALVQLRARYERVFVCSSNWHPQKRLSCNIRLFERLRSLYPNSCLIIMGANPDAIVADPHIFYTGSVESDVYMQVYAAADWMLHLAWADHCPNVVIESLSQRTPVVCGEVGGTKELIGHGAYGMVLKEQSYDFQLCDYDNPPLIDVSQVTFLPTRHELDYKCIPSIDIKDVADQYVKLFDSLTRQ